MPLLTNSKRQLFTATYVATELSPADQNQLKTAPANAFRKANLVRSLSLDRAQIERLSNHVANQSDARARRSWERLIDVSTQLARGGAPVSNLQIAGRLADVSNDVLLQFAELAHADATAPGHNFVLESFKKQLHIAPIGRLHLERLEMVPAGVERGELVFTVPMTPLETVTISHKEWSTSSREFEDIVTDSFESYSERGVAEKTDASMSTENEARHSSEMTFGATLSGTYTGVSLTTTFGLKKTNDERESVKQSLQRNREVTEKSSARAKSEHKVSVKLESKQGSSDSSFRTITNPSTSNAVRVDYYRMMRKWRTDLYRYDLRLTYDMTIPTPGARLFARYQHIDDLDAQLRAPFTFTLKVEDLTDLNWPSEAVKAGAGVAAPPPRLRTAMPTQDVGYIGSSDAFETRLGKLEFDVPDGYAVKTARLVSHVVPWQHADVQFQILDDGSVGFSLPNTGPQTVTSNSPQLIGGTGHLSIAYLYREISAATMHVDLVFERLPELFSKWQLAAWTAIRGAAHARYQEQLATVQQERDRLWLQLSGRDTLSLRRLEREEMLRVILEWMVGPDVLDTAPAGVAATIDKIQGNEHLLMSGAAGPAQPIGEAEWANALAFGDFVKFVQQAVEWENLLYFMYPYFWGCESLGRQKLLFEHVDPEHRNFLRAGYARVVITVRPGFETEFTRLIETGSMSGPATSTYITAAEEIANFAHVNYANLAPANPEKHARPLLYPQQRATWDTMQAVIALLDAHRIGNGSYPASLAALAGGPFNDAWGRPLIYRLPGSGNDYDLFSFGEDGTEGGDDLNADISAAAVASLVGSWFEYTPTSGMDIEIDTKPADIG